MYQLAYIAGHSGGSWSNEPILLVLGSWLAVLRLERWLLALLQHRELASYHCAARAFSFPSAISPCVFSPPTPSPDAKSNSRRKGGLLNPPCPPAEDAGQSRPLRPTETALRRAAPPQPGPLTGSRPRRTPYCARAHWHRGPALPRPARLGSAPLPSLCACATRRGGDVCLPVLPPRAHLRRPRRMRGAGGEGGEGKGAAGRAGAGGAAAACAGSLGGGRAGPGRARWRDGRGRADYPEDPHHRGERRRQVQVRGRPPPPASPAAVRGTGRARPSPPRRRAGHHHLCLGGRPAWARPALRRGRPRGGGASSPLLGQSSCRREAAPAPGCLPFPQPCLGRRPRGGEGRAGACLTQLEAEAKRSAAGLARAIWASLCPAQPCVVWRWVRLCVSVAPWG